MKLKTFVTGAAVLTAVLAFVVACNSPSTPTPPVQQDVANVSTPNPVAGAGPAPIIQGVVPAGATIDIDGGRITVTATKLDFKVCVYELEAAYPGPQRLTHESERFTATGTKVVNVPIPAVCQYQVDVIDWRVCPTSGSPPTFGGGLMTGFLSSGVPCPKQCVESEKVDVKVTYGTWGECIKGEGGKCAKERTKTTTTTTTYAECQNKPPKVETITAKETEACECSCVEGEDPVEAAGPAVWTPGTLPGGCNPEVLPLDYVDASTAVALCHQIGTQPTKIDYECKSDETGNRNLCKNVACVCVPTYTTREVVTYEGTCANRVKVTTTYTKNSCTGEETSSVKREAAPEECSVCETAPPAPGTYVYSGPLTNPTAECAKFGNFVPTCKTETVSATGVLETSLTSCPKSGTLFYLSKCGQSTYVVGLGYPPICPTGQGLGWSHTTGCSCPN